MPLQARWTKVEGWAAGPLDLRRAAVTGERQTPTGLVIRPMARPLKAQCGYRDCGAWLGSAWQGTKSVQLRAGLKFDAEAGLWRLSRRAEDEWRAAARRGVSWDDFAPAARHLPAPSKLPEEARHVMPAVDAALPLLVRCPLCKFVSKLAAKPLDASEGRP